MKPIEGYENLSEAERKIFILGHNKHLSSLKGNERGQYGLGSVVEVKANQQQAATFDFLTGNSGNLQQKELGTEEMHI